MDYFDFISDRLKGYEEGVPGHLGAKDATRPFAQMVGVQTPQLFFEATARELPSKTFPNKFVLKPSFASTSIGIYILEKIEPGLYMNLAKNEQVTIRDLQDACSAVSRDYYGDPERGLFYVEELLTDQFGQIPPRDIRVYAFQGEIGFILAEDHISGIAEASYYNADFTLMDDVHERFGIADSARHVERIVQADPPEHTEEILALARRISTAVPSAFCRVDLYDTPKGVYLGELTFYPGTFYYNNRKLMSVDEARRLGGIWTNAAKRLRGSKLRPAPKKQP